MSILKSICKSFADFAKWLGGGIISKLKSPKGVMILISKFALGTIRSQMFLYFNGGKLHMTKHKARCGDEVELTEFKKHMDMCKECDVQYRLFKGAQADYELGKRREEEIEQILVDSEVVQKSMQTAEGIIKLSSVSPKAAKALQHIWDKFGHLLTEAKEEEEKAAVSSVKSRNAPYLVVQDNGSFWDDSGIESIRAHTEEVTKNRFSSFFSNLKRRYIDSSRKKKAVWAMFWFGVASLIDFIMVMSSGKSFGFTTFMKLVLP